MTRRILILTMAVAAAAFAQGKKGGGGGGNQNQMPMPAAKVSRMDMFSQVLKLDKDQKKQVKTTMDDAQKDATPVRDQMEKGRLAVAQAVAAGKQEEIDAAVKNYAAAESQMANIELSAFTKVFQGLDKDQQAQSPQIFPMFTGIFKGKNWAEVETQ